MKRISLGNVFAGTLVASFAAALYLGCGSPGSLPSGGGSAGNAGGGVAGVTIDPTVLQGGASGSGAGGQGGGGTAGTTGSAEGICGDTTYNANRAPVDIFIVLDRSGSMAYSISDDCYCTGSRERCQDTANCIDRLTAVRGAVEQTVNANPTINWGLELYSAPGSSNQCAVSLTPQVPISPTAGPTVINELGTAEAANYTPTAAAVNAATMYLQTVNDGNSKAILLATDGMPNCPGGRAVDDDDMPAAKAAVAGALRAGFPVYVIGMGPQQSITNLNALAVEGGTGQYYPADSMQALSDALAAISKIVLSTCEFHTPIAPPDDSKVYVYVDKTLTTQVTSPTEDGWMFGATTSDITLTGSYCANLLVGAATTVQIIFGCEDYVPPEIIP
jgi:hypothetical protein